MPRKLLGLAAAVVLALLALAAPAAAAPVPDDLVLPGAGGVELDATLYLPERTPAPAVLVAHGFGGTKSSVDADARALAERGYVVLAWSARGFGNSTGQIALNAPDAEVADARALVDWLANRPEVAQDAPGDPRVGATGGSYGGALALLLAGYDERVDAIAPVITWNDLAQALFPNAATADQVPLDTPARGAFAPDGVFKRGWAGVFFAAGLTPDPNAGTGRDATPPGPATCGRFTPAVCAAYTEAATTGRLSPATAQLLRASSPASVTDRIRVPTLLVQGEQDTLFGLDQADANARQIAGPVTVAWFGGGHDGGPPDAAVRARIGEWFDAELARLGPDPGAGFAYTVVSGVRASSSTPTSRTVHAPGYPGLAGRLQTETLSLEGEPRPVLNPAGGNPAAVTSMPGLGSALGAVAGRVAAFGSELPGQSAQFRTAPMEQSTLVAGAPRIALRIDRLPGQPGPAEAVLFAKTYEVTPDGQRSLLGGAVAPIRVPVPAGGATVTVTLPGVVAPIEAGNRLLVSVSTTDQGYAGSTDPAVWLLRVEGGLGVPLVPGQSLVANSVPLVPAIGIGVVAAAALLAWAIGALRRRSTVPSSRSDTPLEIRGLAKTYKGGFSAVKDVSFDVRQGMVLGLLGPNGAGKTTVLRMLMGLIRPTAGTISAFGVEVGPGSPVLARIGAFVEGPGFLPHLSGLDNLTLYWAATGRPTADAHLDEALDIAGLGDSVHRRVGTYSQGMRQRLAIAQAMLGFPELLVLDEPTNGLDPPQIHAMRDLLRRYAAGGRTVLVSSHLLAEVEQTCTDVVVMHKGRVVASGTVEEIIAGGGAATFAVSAPDEAAAVLSALGVLSVEVDTGAVHAELNGTPRGSAVRALVDAGIDVTSVGPRRRLEDAFLQLVGEDKAP